MAETTALRPQLMVNVALIICFTFAHHPAWDVLSSLAAILISYHDALYVRIPSIQASFH